MNGGAYKETTMEEMIRFANAWIVIANVASGRWNPKKASDRQLMHWFLA
jgi:hypothetical protein